MVDPDCAGGFVEASHSVAAKPARDAAFPGPLNRQRAQRTSKRILHATVGLPIFASEGQNRDESSYRLYKTLFGIHYESKTRQSAAEEIELQFLRERHAYILAECRLRELAMNWRTALASARQGDHSTGSKPLRYSIADWLNPSMKRFTLCNRVFKNAFTVLKRLVRK